MKLCLVVNDWRVIRKVAKALLNSIGYEVVEAETGEGALRFCEDQVPNAILIASDLTDMSGFDFLVQFAKRHPNRSPHIVYSTIANDPIAISRAIQLGATDFITTPFTRADIEAKFPHAAVADPSLPFKAERSSVKLEEHKASV